MEYLGKYYLSDKMERRKFVKIKFATRLKWSDLGNFRKKFFVSKNKKNSAKSLYKAILRYLHQLMRMCLAAIS